MKELKVSFVRKFLIAGSLQIFCVDGLTIDIGMTFNAKVKDIFKGLEYCE